ncbi:MAG: hypothetical protein HFI93_08490 [Lachnospiraceae bacterium]|nr:hypothetical protein [Lachnospiraceae bacterium]
MDDFSAGYSSWEQEAQKGKEILQKALKPKKTGILAGLFFMLLAIAMGIAYFIIGNSTGPEPIFYDPTGDSNDYAYIDVQILTDYFAYYEENGSIKEKFYFALDSNSDPFIVRLTDEQFKNLKEIYDFSYSDSTNTPDPIRITGMPKAIDKELREMAIPSFNEIWDSEYVDKDNFESWLGKTYLDAAQSPVARSQSILLVAGIFLAVFGLLVIILSLPAYRNQKKRLKSLPSVPETQEVYAQIAKSTCVPYPDAPLYLTDDYVVGFSNTIQIVPLSEIRWVYSAQVQSGNIRQNAVIVMTDRSICVAAHKKKHLIDQLASAIYIRVPSALFGYTFENRQAMSEQTPPV